MTDSKISYISTAAIRRGLALLREPVEVKPYKFYLSKSYYEANKADVDAFLKGTDIELVITELAL